MIDPYPDTAIVLRLGTATLVGAIIGFNRDLRGKPTGVRTLGLVSLGAALVVLASMDFNVGTELDPNPASRAIQGVLTGVGFLGAGVIVRDSTSQRIQGMTTAALIWLTACLGIVCGLGAWKVAIVALFFVLTLLLAGSPLDRWLQRRRGAKDVTGRSR